jgi:hypothetical protein
LLARLLVCWLLVTLFALLPVSASILCVLQAKEPP